MTAPTAEFLLSLQDTTGISGLRADLTRLRIAGLVILCVALADMGSLQHGS
jgi:hypothetical protein